METPSPLKGIRVLDLTQVFAGPYCTYELALLGADIIKVEPPGGEQTRFGGAIEELNEQGLGLSFCAQNANKDCVEIDLKTEDGVEALLTLADEVDVFVQNYRPGVIERLGLGEKVIRARNPEIIYCSISAYGGDGPIGHRPAYDHVVQAMSGIMSTTGTEEMGPTKVGAPYIDYATGLNSAFAILAALLEKNRTGKGQLVDISMLDTALNLMANNLVTVATTGRDMPKLGNEAASRAPSSGCFETMDGSLLMLAANNEKQFLSVCKALGGEWWLSDSRWMNPTARVVNQESLRAEMSTAFREKTAQEWEKIFDLLGVPASAVRTINELIEEGQPDARELISRLPVGSTNRKVAFPAIGFKMNGVSLSPDQPPKGVGEDNLKWLQRE